MKCSVCKKNIPDDVLKCPYCKSRAGLLCSKCNTINPLGNLTCKTCGQKLLKICKHCHSVNLPLATKCRKCSTPFSTQAKEYHTDENNNLKFRPKLYTQDEAVEILVENLQQNTKKIFSISGEKGIGKSTVLKNTIKKSASEKFDWCIGKCTSLTQLTPGGVIQDMLLNLFNLPKYYISKDELKKDAVTFFSNEFKFLKQDEISYFLNFLYNSKDGKLEDIIINKKRTFEILYKIFDAFLSTTKFVFVVDNFDFIDGFSVEFFTNFMQRDCVWDKLKFIAIYEEHRPILNYFGFENKETEAYTDINIAPVSNTYYEKLIKEKTHLSKHERELIFSKSQGNPAFIQQAASYCLDCQMSDKTFILPNTFSEVIKERLNLLQINNKQAYRILSIAALLGDRIYPALVREIYSDSDNEFQDIISYLIQSEFIRKINDSHYEFNNLLLWETVLANLKRNSEFDDINIKTGKVLSAFTLNTNAIMASIAHNLRENRMAFDIWTKTTRFCTCIGDINLYVIAQKQCLALLNEFNENETLNIRYNISERLGKLLTEYDPEEALEFLPDAISNAKNNGDENKEIELLGYLALCCKKTENYYGDIECVDNALKKLPTSGYELENAIIKSTKLASMIYIGNCGEAVNLIDNDILPILETHLSNPRLDKTIPLGLIYSTKIDVMHYLARALAIQGNDRSFEILAKLFELADKKKIQDEELICKIKLTLALANTMKGNFITSYEILQNISAQYGTEFGNLNTINSNRCDVINTYSNIDIINRFLLKDYETLQESLFAAVKFANDTGNKFTKHFLKLLLGKIFHDKQQAKHALEIYNEELNYFAKEKNALGALLGWTLTAEATLSTEKMKSAIDIAAQALEIAQNPKINNSFFIILLKITLAKSYMQLADYESAKIHLESGISLAKKYNLNDLLSRLYLQFGKYYKDLGTIQSQKQKEYLKASLTMFNKAAELVQKHTHSQYLKHLTDEQKNALYSYCNLNGVEI
ncbi:MAG: hypothetical protein NC191_04190 [Muribaculaceae bacterium]|nr:hypothetical protein [Muribaculaceae bacterium]